RRREGRMTDYLGTVRPRPFDIICRTHRPAAHGADGTAGEVVAMTRKRTLGLLLVALLAFGGSGPRPPGSYRAEPQHCPDRATEAQGIGLAMSGGGYRATLFHAGALRRLNELGLLYQVKEISSVSGGSITNGELAVFYKKLGGRPNDVISTEKWNKGF